MSVVIIQVVNYNGTLLKNNIFEQCLNSLKNQTYRNTLIHIIDNNSSDNSIDLIKRILPGAKITKNKKNMQYIAHNKGLNFIKYYKPEYVLLLNNDIVLENNFIEKMVEFMNNDTNIGIGAGIMKYFYKRDYINSTGIVLNKAAFSKNRDFLKHQNEELMKERIAALSGGCLFIRRKIIDSMGLFDSMYKAFYEDTDYCLRMQMILNKRIAINRDAICYHAISQTWRKYNFKRRFFSLRNQYILLLKLYPVYILFPAIMYLIKSRLFKQNILHIFIFFNIFFLLPEIFIKRIIISIKSKKTIKELIIDNYKPFSSEHTIEEYAVINNNTIHKEIFFGINDNTIPEGLSFLSDDYPFGRYIIKDVNIKLFNSKCKYIKIHGYGKGILIVNNKDYNVDDFFSIYLNNNFENENIELSLKTDDKIKLIYIGLCDEKT